MQSSLLNARIESILTLAVGAFSVMVIAVGTLGLARSFDPTPDAAVAVAPALERAVITSQRAHAPGGARHHHAHGVGEVTS